MLSAETGQGVDHLRELVAGKQSVVAGQSGVGKSSLLNAIQAGLQLKVRTVSADNEKGRHTTTAAILIPLEAGGFIVDTPGIRQFQLWDIIPEEVAGFFRDIPPVCVALQIPQLHTLPRNRMRGSKTQLPTANSMPAAMKASAKMQREV